MPRLPQRPSRRFCTGGALLPPRTPLADRSSSHRGTHRGFRGATASADDAGSQHACRFWRRPGSSRPPHTHGAPVVQASSPQIPFRCLTPACSGLASLAADARRYAAGISSVGRVRCNSNRIRLGTQGRPCERPGNPGEGAARRALAPKAPCSFARSGAQCHVSPQFCRRARRPIASLTEPRLSRWPAHRAVQARAFASGSAQVSSPARPSSAHAPGRSTARFLSVLVEPSAIVASMNAPAAARVAAGDSPVGSAHALQLSSTSAVSRSKAYGPLHNPGLQQTRFALLARC